MADDKKEEKKDEKKKDAKPSADAAAAAAVAAGGGKSALIGIVAGVVVLVGVGVGVGMFFAKSLTPAPVEVSKPAEKPAANAHGEHGEAAEDAHGAEAPAAGDGHGTGLIATGVELDPIQIKANITGSGGTRYVTFNTYVWVPKADQAHLSESSVRHLIQAKIEETVSTYQLEDLTSPNIRPRMAKDFGTSIERMLRSVMPGRAPESKFVLEIKITDLLNQ